MPGVIETSRGLIGLRFPVPALRHAAYVIVSCALFFVSTAAAHGEEIIVRIFWRAFFVTQAIACLGALLFAPRGWPRFALPFVVVVAAAVLAWFAQTFTESGLVWPGLFVPASLAFLVGIAIASSREQKAT